MNRLKALEAAAEHFSIDTDPRSSTAGEDYAKLIEKGKSGGLGRFLTVTQVGGEDERSFLYNYDSEVQARQGLTGHADSPFFREFPLAIVDLDDGKVYEIAWHEIEPVFYGESVLEVEA